MLETKSNLTKAPILSRLTDVFHTGNLVYPEVKVEVQNLRVADLCLEFGLELLGSPSVQHYVVLDCLAVKGGHREIISGYEAPAFPLLILLSGAGRAEAVDGVALCPGQHHEPLRIGSHY